MCSSTPSSVNTRKRSLASFIVLTPKTHLMWLARPWLSSAFFQSS
jgi:hypothetical protein